MRLDINLKIGFAPEVMAQLYSFQHKLGLILERIDEMATQEQVDKLKADVEALLAAVAAIPVAPPPPAADPALDDLDARVVAATAALPKPA